MKKILFILLVVFYLFPVNNLSADSKVDCFKVYQMVYDSVIEMGLEGIQAEIIATEASEGCRQGGGTGGI